jgi:hypothetical protein
MGEQAVDKEVVVVDIFRQSLFQLIYKLHLLNGCLTLSTYREARETEQEIHTVDVIHFAGVIFTTINLCDDMEAAIKTVRVRRYVTRRTIKMYEPLKNQDGTR